MGVKISVNSGFGLDVRQLDFSSIYYANSYTFSTTNFTAFYNNGADEFRGTGFKYDDYGPIGGTVKSYAAFIGGTRAFIMDGASVSVTSIVKAASTFDTADDMAIIAKALAGSDSVVGGNGAEWLKLYGGNDTFVGNGGNDTVYGGTGNDKITGGLGHDYLRGEAGSDTFIYKSVKDSTVASSGRDTIYDLTVGDKIDLHLIDANSKVAGNQAFTHIGSAAFHGKAGELRLDKHASDTFVYADINGDKKADFAIHFDDAVSLTKGYFVL